MEGDAAVLGQSFSFTHLPSRKLSFLEDRDTRELLMKWSMLGRISAQTFTFDQTFYPYNSEEFALCFFRDLSVVANLRKTETEAWVPLDKQVASVKVEMLPCTKISMDLFDPIYSCGMVRPSGEVVKCFHDIYGDYDEVRQMLQDEDSEHYYVVGRAERLEFLFLLFKHLCLGGEYCQYEDTIEPYISTTRRIYKELIGVQKDPETKKISIVSTVLKVFAYDECGRCYPGGQEEEQTFAYLIIDPFKRHVTLFYHCYGQGSFSL